MKKLLLAIFTSVAAFTNAQTNVYHPFPETDGAWNFTTRFWCWSGVPQPIDNTYSLSVEGDTVISSQTYHKLIVPLLQTTASACVGSSSTFNIYEGCTRQDVSMKKVFYIYPGSSMEELLYDFNMQVGDTVKGHLETYAYPVDTVISIDSVLVGDSYRKRWNINFGYNISIIEGVGSTYGLVEYSPGNGPDHLEYTMNCYQETGTTLYPDASTACELITSVSQLEKEPEQVLVYPNPSAGSFTIDVGNTNVKEIRITDLLGNNVFQKHEAIPEKIMIDNLQKGTYILTIIDKNNRSTNKKIIRL